MTIAKPIPFTIEELEAIFILDHEHGQLVRRMPIRGPAPKAFAPSSYRLISICGRQYMNHRLIWMMAHRQTIPSGMHIDHINRDKHDNRPMNLRLVTGSQNRCNTGKPTTNRSGYKGVSCSYSRGVLQATIRLNGKQHKLGWFDTAAEAAAAYDRAAVELHGEYALTNAALGLLPTTPKRPAPCPTKLTIEPTARLQLTLASHSALRAPPMWMYPPPRPDNATPPELARRSGD
jgi:hypothetical protein